jgi:CheY-like chemotaxis protein
MPAKILVVDDNFLACKLLTSMLADEDCQVRCAMSGPEALAAIADDPPDLILLDIMMPGMDGFEVVRRLKADPVTCAIPIVTVTALDDDGARARLAAAGVDAMLTKPFDRWQLGSLLKRTLGDNQERTRG